MKKKYTQEDLYQQMREYGFFLEFPQSSLNVGKARINIFNWMKENNYKFSLLFDPEKRNEFYNKTFPAGYICFMKDSNGERITMSFQKGPIDVAIKSCISRLIWDEPDVCKGIEFYVPNKQLQECINEWKKIYE